MSIDYTAAGLQHVLPGTERASDATLAQRRAAAPMRRYGASGPRGSGAPMIRCAGTVARHNP